jgi:hypothetical protein
MLISLNKPLKSTADDWLFLHSGILTFELLNLPATIFVGSMSNIQNGIINKQLTI